MAKIRRDKGENNIFVNVAKIVVFLMLVAIQLYVLYAIYKGTFLFSEYLTGVFTLIQLIAVLYIIYQNGNPAYKIAWIIFIMFLPIAGILVYLLWGNGKMSKKRTKEIENIEKRGENTLCFDKTVYEELKQKDPLKYHQAEYIRQVTGYPVYRNRQVQFLEIGETFFENLKEDLKKATHYILMEYFIIAESSMWDEIFDILKEKAKQGVEIKISVDEIGSIVLYPKHFKKKLKEAGIELKIFNPVTPVIGAYLNYRDHRKIAVIDGKVAYNSGINIADEYINRDHRRGHWKDTGVRVSGEAVWSYTLMFLRMWELSTKQEVDYEKYQVTVKNEKESRGYLAFYGDGPNNLKNPAENVYIQLINQARNYIYITTPYLIIDNELTVALSNAARSGVDVRIITPYIPDKKFVQVMTRSFYQRLLEAGVKIYEYKPGFIHSKLFVSDDEVAVVGTINLDFRSLYLHFECGTWIYQTGEELRIKNDFIDTMNVSLEVDLESWKKRSFIKKVTEAILTAFAPLM